MNTPPAHRSFSQLQTWLTCQHQYYLSKIAQVPERPAVYLAAGNAVHTMLESINHRFYLESYLEGMQDVKE